MLRQNTQNTSKMRTSFAIDFTNRFDKKSHVYFLQTAESYRKVKQMDPCNSRQRNTDLQLSFYVNMLNFAVLLYIVLTTHQLNIHHLIFCITGCF